MSTVQGRIIGVNGNMITVQFDGAVAQNEVGYARLGELRLMSEIVRVRGRFADLQVFEDTTGLAVGDAVEFSGELLTVELGPGLLTQVFDGLQNPLPKLAEQCGFFLQRGTYLPALPRDREWDVHAVRQGGRRPQRRRRAGRRARGYLQAPHHGAVPVARAGDRHGDRAGRPLHGRAGRGARQG